MSCDVRGLERPLFHVISGAEGDRISTEGSAADEMNHLEFVSVVEDGLAPTVAGDDVTIEFDGDTVGFHGEGFYQSGESGNRRIEGPFFPVDLEFHDV
jgi:hypothetical protein